MSRNPYGKASFGGRSVYSSSRSEISMRDEFFKTLNGSFPEIAKGQVGVLRTMRRGSDGRLVLCACRDEVFGEPQKAPIACPLCSGEGFYWTETFVKFYQMEPGYDTGLALREERAVVGNLNVSSKVFYIDYQEELTAADKVVELVLDKNGSPVTPYRRRAIYKIGTLYGYRADNGRLEYWKVVGVEDKTVPLNVG